MSTLSPTFRLSPLATRRTDSDRFDSAAVSPLKRKRSKRGEGDRLRDEILDAVDTILAENPSPDAVSIRAVAERVGCTPPAIYLHFFDKQELLFDVCARQFAKMNAEIEAATATIDPKAKIAVLEARMRAYIQFGLKHPEHYRILFMGSSVLTTDQQAELRRSGVGGFDRLVDVCKSCIKAGYVFDTDAKMMAFSCWSLTHGIVSLYIAKPSPDWPNLNKLIDNSIGNFIRGIARPTEAS